LHLGFKPGEEAPLVPLVLKTECCETDENLARNVARTLDRPYVRFNEYVESQTGSVSVCGFGPSLKRTYKHLVGDVLACNGAHDWLIEQGIVPKWCLLMDAAPVMTKLVTPHPGVTYFVASRCHEALFEHLKDARVVVWHCAGDPSTQGILEQRGLMEPMVCGGTAGVTRGMVFVKAMGYTDIHLFGADSSFEGDTTHVRKSVVPETAVKVWAKGEGEGRWFQTTAWMAGQVEDLKILTPGLKEDGAVLTVHGDGLFPFVAQAIGLPVIEHKEE
jgi:hypothetical protein